MKKTFSFLLLISLAVSCFASVPSWVQPGVVVTYDGYSSFISQGQPQNPVVVETTMQVNSVSGNTVSGTTTVQDVGVSGLTQSYPWTCIEGGVCDWKFWVDSSNPAQSFKGPNGETLSIMGRSSYSHGQYSTQDATLLTYQNPQTNFEIHVTYETKTGLLLAYAEKYSTQQTYLYFKNINTDLSGYQAPQAAPQQQAGYPQQQGQQSFTPPEEEICTGAFILLFTLFGTAFYSFEKL